MSAGADSVWSLDSGPLCALILFSPSPARLQTTVRPPILNEWRGQQVPHTSHDKANLLPMAWVSHMDRAAVCRTDGLLSSRPLTKPRALSTFHLAEKIPAGRLHCLRVSSMRCQLHRFPHHMPMELRLASVFELIHDPRKSNHQIGQRCGTN